MAFQNQSPAVDKCPIEVKNDQAHSLLLPLLVVSKRKTKQTANIDSTDSNDVLVVEI